MGSRLEKEAMRTAYFNENNRTNRRPFEDIDAEENELCLGMEMPEKQEFLLKCLGHKDIRIVVFARIASDISSVADEAERLGVPRNTIYSHCLIAKNILRYELETGMKHFIGSEHYLEWLEKQ